MQIITTKNTAQSPNNTYTSKKGRSDIMEIADAWQQFLQTGNVLDYLRYSALRNADKYFEPAKKEKGDTDMPDKNNSFIG